MREDFNNSVFESMPDSVWTGRMPVTTTRVEQRRKAFRVVAYIAAAFSVPLAAATIILSNGRSAAPAMEPIASSEIVYKVNNAVRGEIVLPDSTLVTLNSGSTLRLSEDFGETTRTVWLDGEAYFDVHKDNDHPFYINTPQNVVVKVTGTKFNMQCFSDNPKFDLTLLQGSVEITKPNNEIIHVIPNQEVVINNDFHNVSLVDEPEDSLVWTQGALKCDRTPMSEAIAQIERWYGVELKVSDDSIFRSSFTAEFRSETLTEVLNLLCITSQLSYTVDGEVITLKSNR